MAARAIWKGTIRIGSVKVPVKLYSAVEDRGIHFRLLHAPDKQPVVQRMVNPESGTVVESKEVRKAYRDEDVLVMLEPEELESLEPEPSRDIEITRFVPSDAVGPQWYERPYYLGPDDSTSQYFALAEALKSEERHGIARWVMRKKEYVGALVPAGDYLMLMTLRHAEEVVPASALPEIPGREPDAKERKLAEQLIAALEDEFDPAAYQDEYRERVMEYIEARAKGKVVKLKKPRAKRTKEPESLAGVLEASLKQRAKEQKSA